MWRFIVAYAVGKGLVMGPVVVAVIRSGLTPFQQAIVIAVISAMIGALGMVTAALIAARATREAAAAARESVELGRDIKRSLGADRRDGDA